MLTSSSRMYSIAISKLFAVSMILLYCTLISIFSRIGVVVIQAVAWETTESHFWSAFVDISNFMKSGVNIIIYNSIVSKMMLKSRLEKF